MKVTKISKLFLFIGLALFSITTFAWMCPVVKVKGDDKTPAKNQPSGPDSALTCNYGKHTCVYTRQGKTTTATLAEKQSAKEKDFSCPRKIH